LNAVGDYLSRAKELSEKLNASIEIIYSLIELADFNINKFNELLYFKYQLDKHVDLVRRRLILKQDIPHEEKIFSLFEPHTEWIKKGKASIAVELGLRIAIATDQYGFILRHQVMQQQQDVDIAVSLIKALVAKKSINSVSFDKGFWNPQNYKQLKVLVAELIMPKKGKLNKTEYEREHTKRFTQLRRNHAAVESAINGLEHHGLNRCPDKGIDGFTRYTAPGVLGYNLHKLGNILLEQDRKQLSKNQALLKAA
jgi:IS5 family transposase